MSEMLRELVGESSNTMVWYQMCVRAVVIFFFLLLLVRVGGKRVFGKNTSFDIVLGVLLGSVLSRALTGNAPLVPTLAASALLVLLHVVLARIAFHSPAVGHLVKGRERRLVASGRILPDAMRRDSITPHDLAEALRLQASTDEVEGLEAVYLERSGDISVIRA